MYRELIRVEHPPMSANTYTDRDIIDSVSAKAYWPNTGQLPVVYWSTVGLVSVASREIVDH